MRTNAKILSILCAFLLLGVTAVSAYNFVINDHVVLQGTTFQIDGVNFRESGGEIQVRLTGVWYKICPESHTTSSGHVTMLESVVCNFIGEEAVCSQAGGGCGGG